MEKLPVNIKPLELPERELGTPKLAEDSPSTPINIDLLDGIPVAGAVFNGFKAIHSALKKNRIDRMRNHVGFKQRDFSEMNDNINRRKIMEDHLGESGFFV